MKTEGHEAFHDKGVGGQRCFDGQRFLDGQWFLEDEGLRLRFGAGHAGPFQGRDRFAEGLFQQRYVLVVAPERTETL